MTETQSPLPPPIRALTARVAEEIQASFERAIHLESLTADTLREQRRFMPAVDQYLAREGVSQTDPWWRHAVPALLFRRTRLFAGDAAAVTRVFQSSGTTDPERRSQAAFSDAGLRLMDVAMHENASRMLFPDGRATRILVLAPSPEATPTMIMAYGMARLIDRFGLEGSSFLVGPDGLDSEALVEQLEHACAQSTPVTLIGASFGFVHLLDRFGERGVRLALPQGSRTMHAGGFKGRSREVRADELEGEIYDRLGVPRERTINALGMTELASQFYDDSLAAAHQKRDTRLGKINPPWTATVVVDPGTLEPVAAGEEGVLVHLDLANVERPAAVRTNDLGRQLVNGFEILGRAKGVEEGGCSLTVDDLAART